MTQIKLRRIINQAFMDGRTCDTSRCYQPHIRDKIMCSNGESSRTSRIKCYLWVNLRIKSLLKGEEWLTW